VSSAAELWDEYQALKAQGAPLPLRGRVYERWFAQACREGHDPSRLRRDAPTISERIDARIIEGLDGCLIWDGRLNERNQPVVNGPKSRSDVSVRRYLLARADRVAPPYRRVYAKCGNRRCVALEHLVVEEHHWRRQYSDEQMLGKLQVFALRLGRPPLSTEWRAARQQPHDSYYCERFGSWADALRKAGLEPGQTASPRTPLAERSHCVNGHPVTPGSLEPNGHGKLRCRLCRNEARARARGG